MSIHKIALDIHKIMIIHGNIFFDLGIPVVGIKVKREIRLLLKINL